MSHHIADLRQTEGTYRRMLQQLLACYTTASSSRFDSTYYKVKQQQPLLDCVREIFEAHSQLILQLDHTDDAVCMQRFKQWLGQTLPLYQKYLSEMTFEPETSLETTLKSEPVLRLAWFAQLTHDGEIAKILQDYHTRRRSTLEKRAASTIKYDNVRCLLSSTHHVVANDALKDVIEKSSFRLTLPKLGYSNVEVELYHTSNGLLSILAVEPSCRSLLFPSLRSGDLEIVTIAKGGVCLKTLTGNGIELTLKIDKIEQWEYWNVLFNRMFQNEGEQTQSDNESLVSLELTKPLALSKPHESEISLAAEHALGEELAEPELKTKPSFSLPSSAPSFSVSTTTSAFTLTSNPPALKKKKSIMSLFKKKTFTEVESKITFHSNISRTVSKESVAENGQINSISVSKASAYTTKPLTVASKASAYTTEPLTVASKPSLESMGTPQPMDDFTPSSKPLNSILKGPRVLHEPHLVKQRSMEFIPPKMTAPLNVLGSMSAAELNVMPKKPLFKKTNSSPMVQKNIQHDHESHEVTEGKLMYSCDAKVSMWGSMSWISAGEAKTCIYSDEAGNKLVIGGIAEGFVDKSTYINKATATDIQVKLNGRMYSLRSTDQSLWNMLLYACTFKQTVSDTSIASKASNATSIESLTHRIKDL